MTYKQRKTEFDVIKMAFSKKKKLFNGRPREIKQMFIFNLAVFYLKAILTLRYEEIRRKLEDAIYVGRF